MESRCRLVVSKPLWPLPLSDFSCFFAAAALPKDGDDTARKKGSEGHIEERFILSRLLNPISP